MDFVDRLLACADCRQSFIFTAGEQLFFFDKQFKNDPKRCKTCKARRAGGTVPVPGAPLTSPAIRTETRTTCSDCGIETTVPFKPTQGRPVLCRQCFQLKRAAVSPTVMVASTLEEATAELVAVAANIAAFEHGAGSEAISAAIQMPQA